MKALLPNRSRRTSFGMEKFRDRFLQGFMFPTEDFFAPFSMGYVLLSLHGENYPADLNTDVVAMYLRRQSPDGQSAYALADTRPPLCLSYIGQTALAMRSLQLYAPKTDKAGYEKAIQLAATWIAQEPSRNTEDASWKVLGLAWSDREQAARHPRWTDSSPSSALMAAGRTCRLWIAACIRPARLYTPSTSQASRPRMPRIRRASAICWPTSRKTAPGM